MDNSYSKYRRDVTERASYSIDRLSDNLNREPAVPFHNARTRSRSPGSPPRRGIRQSRSPAWERQEREDYSFGAAVERLRSSLNQYEAEGEEREYRLHISPRSRSVPDRSAYHYVPSLPNAPVPSLPEAGQLLTNQNAMLIQVQAEKTYVQEELKTLKLKVSELAEENRLLHEELKRSVIHEIVNEGLDVPGIPRSMPFGNPIATAEETGGGGAPNKLMTRQDYGRWQRELERITELHTAKASRLEVQLAHTREELKKSEQDVSDVSGQLRMLQAVKEGGANEDAAFSMGVCVRCGKNDAVLPESVLSSQRKSLQTVTQERDSLLDQLAALKAQYTASRQGEDDAYDQVKKSVEMVEQGQMELTQALIQREQLREELENMKGRMEQHVTDMANKMGEDREMVRAETKKEREEMNTKLKELTTSLVETQSALEKITRDKVALLSEVDEARTQVDTYGMDYGKATDSMKMSVTQATIERNTAVQNMSKLKQDLYQSQREQDQVKEKFQTEVMGLRRRLEQAEKGWVESKEECVRLTNTVTDLEKEVHLAKLARESIEKNRSDDVKQVMIRAEKREQELNGIIDQIEQRNCHVSGELEDLVHSQGSLVHKLRAECKRLAHQLEDQTHKYKRDNKKLKAAKEQLMTRLERATRRLQEIEDQHTQQAQLHEKMRTRLKQMDSHAINSGGQIIELLGKESSLLRERSILAREVEFLRKQLCVNGVDTNRFCSSHSVVVDDILSTVKLEQCERAGGSGTASAQHTCSNNAMETVEKTSTVTFAPVSQQQTLQDEEDILNSLHSD